MLYRAYILAPVHRPNQTKSVSWSSLRAKRRRGGAVWSNLTSTKTKLKINHLRSSPGPPELAGLYVDSHFPRDAAH